MSISCAAICENYSVHGSYINGAVYCSGCGKYMQLERIKCSGCNKCSCTKCTTVKQILNCKCVGCKGCGCVKCKGSGRMKALRCPCCRGKLRTNAKKKKGYLHRY